MYVRKLHVYSLLFVGQHFHISPIYFNTAEVYRKRNVNLGIHPLLSYTVCNIGNVNKGIPYVTALAEMQLVNLKDRRLQLYQNALILFVYLKYTYIILTNAYFVPIK